MSAVDYFTYDGDSGSGVAPHRPGVDHMGGADKLDDQERPPDPETMPTAAAWNQFVKLFVGLAKVTPSFVLSVRFVGGDPTVDLFNAVGTQIDAGDLTITDNGDGDTTIEWPAGSLPQPTCRPCGLTINADEPVDEMRAVPVTNGVRVITKASSGGGDLDADFSLQVFGQ